MRGGCVAEWTISETLPNAEILDFTSYMQSDER